MRILIFGDSITYGKSCPNGGWYTHLWRYFQTQILESTNATNLPTPINLGIDANNTTDLLNRFDSETKARDDEQELAFVFAIGINDSKTSAKGIPIEQFIQNIDTLWNKAKKYSNKILFLGFNYCYGFDAEPGLFDEIKVKEYNDALEQFCIENKIDFVQMYEKFKKEHQKSNLLYDKLHPNEQGHTFMAELILPQLLNIIES